MPPSANEVETEKPPEYTPIKILLKQVYAAHTAKVKELESEVQNLKQELEGAKREIGENGKTICTKCREMQLAYDACKEEYKNAVLEQTRKLKELELKFLSIEKSNCRSPNKSSCKTLAEKEKLESHATAGATAHETPGESLALLDWDESTLKISVDSRAVQNCPSANLSEERSASGHMMPPPVSATAAKTALNRRKIFGRETSLSESTNPMDSLINDDVVLVPDSLEASRVSSPMSENLKRVGKEKTVELSPENKENDAARTGSNEPSQKIRKCSLSKKRALSDVTFSDSHNNKRLSTEQSAETQAHRDSKISITAVTDHNELHADGIQPKKPEVTTKNESSKISETSKRKVPLKKAEEVLKVTESWAANFEDFDLESSNMQQSFSVITGIRNPKPDVVITDEDFHMPVSKVDESGSWKISLKKNVPKKPAPVKSIKPVSRFKMTLEAPDLNAKKPSYKQMKLTSSVFQSKNAPKDNASLDDCQSNDSKPSACGKASTTSQVGLSELASLAGLDQTCISSDPRPTIQHADSDVSSSACPQLSGDVETFCVIDAITVSKDSCNADEKLNLDDDDDGLKIIEIRTSDHAGGEEEQKVVNKNICDSFDRLPVPQEPNYKYKDDTVRNKSKRKQLNGFNCKDCEKYYTELGLNEEERKERMQQCSRHRAKYVPPPTPDHFWELDFPNTEECKARGYVAATQNIQLKSRRRRPLADEQFT